jgi:hypothetical protein
MLKEFMPFVVKPIDDGFKYIGCFLKPNFYTKADWTSLEKKLRKEYQIGAIDG